MDNGYSIAYFSKPYMFIVNIIVYYTHTYTLTHKLWALPMFAKVILQSSKTYKNIIEVA